MLLRMKGPLDRTKIVLRHLPPALPRSTLSEQIDSRFSGRYNWLYFRPGKTRSESLYDNFIFMCTFLSLLVVGWSKF